MKLKKKIVYKFNQNNKYGDEWDHLQEQVKEYTKMNEINGWKNLFSNETIIKASDWQKNTLFTNMKEVEPYDLTCENHMQPKKNVQKKIR